MTWFQIWTVCWQVAIVVTPLVVALCMLWLRSQFPTKTEFFAERSRIDGLFHAVDAKFATEKVERDQRYDNLKDRFSDHEGRLKMVEADVARPPSRHALNNAIATMQGGLHAVERGVDDMRRQMEAQSADLHRQMETLNSYLHTMIEKHIA